jgi:hypothetical protein
MTTHKICQALIAVTVLVLVAAMPIFVSGCSFAALDQSYTQGNTDGNGFAPPPAAPPAAPSPVKAGAPKGWIPAKFSNTSRKMTDKAVYLRVLSWWGQGGPEAATKHQGIGVGKHGEITIGGNKGTGVLERFWSWLKSTFWTVAIGTGGIAIVLGVLSVIPQTSKFATPVLRWLASLVPMLGSAVEWLRGKMVWKKPLDEVVDGGEIFKAKIAALPTRLPTETGEGFTAGQKGAVKQAFQDAHGDAQTGNTPTIVKAITG